MTALRLVRALGVLAVVLAAALALAVALGSEPLDVAAALRGVHPDAFILASRAARTALAAIVGAALGISGAALQALVENPLADPFVLGLSGGAAIGATAAIAAGLGAMGLFGGSLVGLLALAGALAAALLVFSLGRVHGRLVPERLLLVGVVFNAFASSFILAVQSVAAPDRLQSLLSWMLGSIGYPSPAALAAGAGAVLAAAALLTWRAPWLNALCLGETEAHSLGVNPDRARATVFAACAVLVAAATSLAGVIGFAGLIVPHLVRLAFGSDHRVLVPGSALGGAAFLALADLGARLFFRAAHTEPPTGMITALVGAPLFLWLLVSRTRRSER